MRDCYFQQLFSVIPFTAFQLSTYYHYVFFIRDLAHLGCIVAALCQK